ncbi:hypothetical protein CLW00_102192 [Mongoliibacter ruber]|uniref:Uncharacterized protein n=1 Tax=Mongoliibacter ruber TaxID=1750599 RepID=A0A2T0WSP7_9BACT|nr:hypothetical protein CLW00_102192 [Mongoliibacter ruber]
MSKDYLQVTLFTTKGNKSHEGLWITDILQNKNTNPKSVKNSPSLLFLFVTFVLREKSVSEIGTAQYLTDQYKKVL